VDQFPDRGVSTVAKFFREDQAGLIHSRWQQWLPYRKLGRGLHSFTLVLNLSNSRTHS